MKGFIKVNNEGGKPCLVNVSAIATVVSGTGGEDANFTTIKANGGTINTTAKFDEIVALIEAATE